MHQHPNENVDSCLHGGHRPSLPTQVIESAHLIGTNPQLAGILSQPVSIGESSIRTGIVILSSGLLHRVGPYRLHVNLARSLSMAGYSVLRLDQAGRGDSSESRGLSVAETIQQEFETIAEFFQKARGIDKLVLIGLCSGADDALTLASKNENVCGLVLLDGYARPTIRYYVHYYLPRVLNLGRIMQALMRRATYFWKSARAPKAPVEKAVGQSVDMRNFPSHEQATTSVANLMQRGGGMLSVFTGGVEEYYCYEGQLRDCLQARRYGNAFKEIYLRDADHTYPVGRHRQSLVRLVTEWCRERIA